MNKITFEQPTGHSAQKKEESERPKCGKRKAKKQKRREKRNKRARHSGNGTLARGIHF
jgi:hypothetical protein